MSCVLTSHLRCAQCSAQDMSGEAYYWVILDKVGTNVTQYGIQDLCVSPHTIDWLSWREYKRDNTFDKVIKTIDTKTKSAGMIIVMPTRIVANVNLIPCPKIAPARTATDSIILTKENISQKEWDLLGPWRTFGIVTVCCLVDPVLSLWPS